MINVSLFSITTIAVFLATLFQTVAGFGYAIIGVPILSMFLGVKEAVVFILISGTYMRIFMLYLVRKEIDFSVVKLLFIGSLIGVVPGALVLKFVSASTLNIILGTTLVLAIILLKRRFTWKTIHEKLEAILFGIVGGFFTASTGVGGPPAAMYMVHKGKSKEESRADLICYFVLCNIWTLSIGYFIGTMKIEDFLGMPLWTIPAGFLGMYAGEKIFRYINQRVFNLIAMLAIVISALTMIYKGLIL